MKKPPKSCRDENELVVIKALYKQQESLPANCRITKMESKAAIARIKVLEQGVQSAIRPIIKIDKNKLYERLMVNRIINKKKKPSSKIDITSSSDYNIILYFKNIAHGLLSYYRCADDFYKIKNIVKCFIKFSAVSTLKNKHKLASRKKVIEKYGINLECTNHKGNTISFPSNSQIDVLRKEYLTKPDINWSSKLNKVWRTYSDQNPIFDKCIVTNCKTPKENLEIHHIRKLHRHVDHNNQVIIKGISKRLSNKDMLKSGLKRKQLVLCREHHKELHKGTLDLNLIKSS